MIKDIVVHLTGSEEDNVRIDHAESIAVAFDAHLTGLQVHALPDILSITDPTGSAVLQDLLAASLEQAGAVTEKLKARFARLSVTNDLRRIDAYPGAVGNALAAEARVADLFVGTRPYGDPLHQQQIEEAVLFRSGRGCLFVPPRQAVAPFESVLVAWKGTREAARAVAEALPFLKRARQVIVAIVEEEGAGEQFGVEAGADIGRYLSRHGVSAEIRKLAGWEHAGDALLNEAQRTGVDLIAMGGYGHSRFREWALSGATRDVLANAPIPVLMAH